MTEHERNIALAEKVMGWKLKEDGFTKRIGPGEYYVKWGKVYRHEPGRYDRIFNPHDSASDFLMVLSALQSAGWEWYFAWDAGRYVGTVNRYLLDKEPSEYVEFCNEGNDLLNVMCEVALKPFISKEDPAEAEPCTE